MAYKNIAIDCSNLYWRCVCTCLKSVPDKVKEGNTSINVYTSVIQDFIDRVNNLKKEYLFDTGKVYLLFDNPKSTLTLRQVIDEEYKSPRMQRIIPKIFWDTLKVLKQVLLHYDDSFVFLQYPLCEADDLVKPLTENITIDENNRLLLISADMDWSRGISKNIDWFNFNKIYNIKEFYEKYNFKPERKNVVVYKCFRGDASDNIESGLPNFPEKLLLQILEKNEVSDYHSFRDFLKGLQSCDFLSNDWKLKIKDAEERLLKNFQLTNYLNVDAKFNEMKIECKEYISVLKSYYKILQLPFETKMLSEEEYEDSFFQEAKFTRKRKFFK